MHTKIDTKTFFWLLGVLVVVLIATFGTLYHQGSETLTKIQEAREAAIKVEARQESNTAALEALSRSVSRAHRADHSRRGSTESGDP